MQISKCIGIISDIAWSFFLPLMLILGIYLSIKTFYLIRKKHFEDIETVEKVDIITPAAVGLGNMIGTSAIIGGVGSLSKLVAAGQIHFEAIIFWALIGSIIMLLVTYSEVFCSKVMNKMPKHYISYFLSPALSHAYCIAFILLYVFGFSGYQFSGIDAVATAISFNFFNYNLSILQRYIFIIFPMIIFLFIIFLYKKHSIIIRTMSSMISLALLAYSSFFIAFVLNTFYYISDFFEQMYLGIMNPVNAATGIPLGLIFGMQRILCAAETGLGSMPMVAYEANTKPKDAALIAFIPSLIVVFISSVIPSYICSYGVAKGFINFPAGSLDRLIGFFNTALNVTGSFGLILLCFFILFSALTTILGSYLFIQKLLNISENNSLILYFIIIFIAGILSVCGFNIIFDLVDLLLFVVCGINMCALVRFIKQENFKFGKEE